MKWRALAALGAAACAVPPAGHLGQVTSTAAAAGRSFSCSQAGVFEDTPQGPRFFADPGLRPFALAGLPAGEGLPAALLVGGGAPAQSGDLALLALDGRVLARARLADDVVYGVAMSAHGGLAAAACADGGVVLCALPDFGAPRTRWRHARPAVAVAFSPDGALLASAGHDGVVLLGEPRGDAPPRALLDHTAAVTCLLWSPDGQRLASGARDGKVRLHDPAGRLVHTWQRLGGEVAALAFAGASLDYQLAAVAGEAARGGRLALP